jgi:hypothetical protein
MIFGSDLFFAAPLEMGFGFEIAGEIGFLAQMRLWAIPRIALGREGHLSPRLMRPKAIFAVPETGATHQNSLPGFPLSIACSTSHAIQETVFSLLVLPSIQEKRAGLP